MNNRPDWWNDVPEPVRRKKRIYRTVTWEECPKCGRELGTHRSGYNPWQTIGALWEQDLRENPPRRTYLPCRCVVVGELHVDAE
jgi:hypothetical protein